MAEHYYTNSPTSAHEERHVSVQAGDRCLRFETDAGTFSKQHLDPGSRLLIETVPPLSGRCADIGCGWGAIGVALAVKNPELAVEMVDVNERAVALAQKNAEINGAANARAYVSRWSTAFLRRRTKSCGPAARCTSSSASNRARPLPSVTWARCLTG